MIGGGPAGLMAAEILSAAGVAVTVYERMPSAGRKLLMAGRGGLNLTHSEDIQRFLSRYGPAAEHLESAVAHFSPADLRAWSEGLGQPTFVGTSGRVFPQAMKASPLLRAWLHRLDSQGVRFAFRHRWTGWNEKGCITFTGPAGEELNPAADVTVMALGGASWPKLGADGGWAEILQRAGIAVTPLRPANCGFLTSWSEIFRDRFEGAPLKRIVLRAGGHTIRGEIVLTREGVEGGAVYALSPVLRESIAVSGEAALEIDLRPDETQAALAARLAAPRGKQSLSNFLRKAAHLSPPAIGLLQEAARGKLSSMHPDAIAALMKSLPLRLTAVAGIERAISTAGGVSFAGVDADFMLRVKPGVFVAGEMLDWEAPTGGYLLQACFATGVAAAHGALRWLARQKAGARV